MPSYNIAVLMTVFNRKQTTLECLKRIIPQAISLKYKIVIYMVDDGDDHTGIAVYNLYPEYIHLIKGTGSLYWCGGMRLAFSQALEKAYDYFLWLNDDAMLYSNALETMIATSITLTRKVGKTVLIAGSFQDPKTGKLTYGGYKVKTNFWLPVNFTPVCPTQEPKQCDVFNGNFVLIPRRVANDLGNLKEEFTHGAGDYEYAIRAKRYGYSSWIAPGYMGACERGGTEMLNRTGGAGKKKTLEVMKSDVFIQRVRDWQLLVNNFRGIWIPFYRFAATLRIKFPLLWILINRWKRMI